MVNETRLDANYRFKKQIQKFRNSLSTTHVSGKKQPVETKEEYSEPSKKSDSLYGIPEFLNDLYRSVTSVKITPKTVVYGSLAAVAIAAAAKGAAYMKDKLTDISGLNGIELANAFQITGYDVADILGGGHDGINYKPQNDFGNSQKKVRDAKKKAGYPGPIVKAAAYKAPANDFGDRRTDSGYQSPLDSGNKPFDYFGIPDKLGSIIDYILRVSGITKSDVVTQTGKTISDQGGAKIGNVNKNTGGGSGASGSGSSCQYLVPDPKNPINTICSDTPPSSSSSSQQLAKDAPSDKSGGEPVVVKTVAATPTQTATPVATTAVAPKATGQHSGNSWEPGKDYPVITSEMPINPEDFPRMYNSEFPESSIEKAGYGTFGGKFYAGVKIKDGSDDKFVSLVVTQSPAWGKYGKEVGLALRSNSYRVGADTKNLDLSNMKIYVEGNWRVVELPDVDDYIKEYINDKEVDNRWAFAVDDDLGMWKDAVEVQIDNTVI